MKRALISATGLSILIVLSAQFAGAGPGATWTSSPTSGPSPNTISVSGTGCQPQLQDNAAPPPPPRMESAGFGGLVVAQAFQTGTVTVELRNLADTATLHSQTYPATEGTWGGPFSIPGGLSPGTYPLKASCAPVFPSSAGVTLGQSVDFDYQPDRSYTVVAQTRRPDPVDAEVTFTG